MRLYQHSARCPVVLQLFLNCNPIYWCFIPLPRQEALAQDFAYLKEIHAENFTLPFNMPTSARHERKVERHLSRVPLPQTRSMFSYSQTEKQRQFFDHFLLSDVDQLPY